jgi:hypothetical protein
LRNFLTARSVTGVGKLSEIIAEELRAKDGTGLHRAASVVSRTQRIQLPLDLAGTGNLDENTLSHKVLHV